MIDIEERKAIADQLAKEDNRLFVEKHTKVVNAIFSTEEGKMFWNELSAYCSLYNAETGGSNEAMRELAGRRQVQLNFIYKFLSTETRRYLNGAK